jgi:hypothetical protein
MRTWFRWTPYARAVRLLALERRGARRIAKLALMDEATPVWYRVRIDLATMRIPWARMIADAHFMTRRYYAFNRPVRIRPPRAPARDG